MLDNLKPLRWLNRIILAEDREAETPMVSALESRSEDIVQRDILWFVWTEGGLRTNMGRDVSAAFRASVPQRYFIRSGPDRTGVVLIGKDGGVKARSGSLDLDEIFRLIDSMPMRMAEMDR